MIIVEVKEKQQTDFPKLMIDRDKDIIEVHRHPKLKDTFIGIWRTGGHLGKIGLDFNIVGLSNYEGEITIKNV